MDHILEFFRSEHYDDILGIDLQIIQAWVVVALNSKFYTVSTVLFHKYGGANVAVANCMSHFSMFVPTKATMKLDNGNTGHNQIIGIILCCFPNCSIIYKMGTVYYCQGRPANTLSPVSLKFYVCSRKVTYNILNIVSLLNLKGVLGDHPNRLKTISTIFK